MDKQQALKETREMFGATAWVRDTGKPGKLLGQFQGHPLCAGSVQGADQQGAAEQNQQPFAD